MSYNVWAHYAAETNRKSPLKADAKPSVGILYGRNRPSYQTNDTNPCHTPSTHGCILSRKRKVMREKTVVRHHLQKTQCQTHHGKVMREEEPATFINDAPFQAA